MKKKTKKDADFTPRLQKPSFRDPKLLIGILLILASVLAVVVTLRLGNKTEPYYVARTDLQVGQRVSASDLQIVEVRLGSSSSHYLASAGELPEDFYVTSFISAGELISTRDISQKVDDRRREVTLSLDAGAASNLEAGKKVDIWVAMKKENSQEYESPQPIMVGAEVASKKAEESIIGGTGKTAVTLLVAEESLPAVLNAVNNSARVSLIPTHFGGEQATSQPSLQPSPLPTSSEGGQ